MNSNPIRNHCVGATGCDGTLLGFVKSRHIFFKYHSGRGGDFTEIYKLLSTAALICENPEARTALIGLKTLIDQLASVQKHAKAGLDEAELCMNTLTDALTKIDQQIEEQVNLDLHTLLTTCSGQLKLLCRNQPTGVITIINETLDAIQTSQKKLAQVPPAKAPSVHPS